MRGRLFPIFGLIGALIFSSPLAADAILLRNGSRVEGKIVAQSRTNVRIKNEAGFRDIPRPQIRRITFGAYDPERARKQAAERARKQQELIRQQQEAFRQQQAALLKQQQEQLRLQQEQEAAAERQREEAAAARRKQEAAETAAREAEAKRPALWLSLLVPGLRQWSDDRPVAGTVFAGGALVGLGVAGVAEAEFAGLAANHAELDQFITLHFLSTGGGDALDFLLTVQRDGLATRMNATNSVAAGGGALVLAAYLFNAGDLLLNGANDRTALRLSFAPDRMSLAFEVRF